ncbi:unnamed protein product [Mytilus edulis]|uniref:Uncharacterized protein n=1 Tax=Mytilus edulis TaxID=6550 RepID=A0A8S3RKQ1_MYTED|nr:unnamed protein product [Mytilus edulis]
MPSKNGINRLYHSNVNLPRSVTQYEITKNLGKSLESLPKFKTIIDEKKKSLAYEEKGERLSLLLPHIEPDCDLDLSVNVRDASASYISTPENRENRARSSDKSNDEALDYLTNYDDDNDTAKSKLHKLGIYEMEHNWILHETLEKNLEDFKKKGKKLEIPEPDYESKAPVTDRLKEIRSMLKPRAELGDFMSKMDPVQREKIWVSLNKYNSRWVRIKEREREREQNKSDKGMRGRGRGHKKILNRQNFVILVTGRHF